MVRFTRLLVAVVVLALLVPACAPAAARPTTTPAPTVAPAITPDAAQPLVLVLPGSSEQKNLIAVNRHYSDVVKRKGWNVDFYTVQQIVGGDGEDSYIQYIAKQLSAGAARADGYFGWFGSRGGASIPLDEAKTQGLLYDCAAAAPQVIPDYWARFQEQIVGARYGLPLCYSPQLRVTEYALVLQGELRGLVSREPVGYDDIRALLDLLHQPGSQNDCLCSNYHAWVGFWLQQQGYMPLFESSGIYTRVDDPDAKPVMLEDVPGFETFFKETFALRSAGSLDLSFDMPGLAIAASKSLPPAVLDDAGSFVTPYVERDWSGYTVIPLHTDPTYSDNAYYANYLRNMNGYSTQLVIPAKSRRTANAMAFVQWIYALRDNAECLVYGQLGEDFTLQGERLALSPAYIKQMSKMEGNSWYGSGIFSVAAQSRISVNAPENAESLRDPGQQLRIAAPWLGHLMDQDLRDIMYSTNNKRQRQIIQLYNDLYNRSLSEKFDAGAWIEALRQATTEDFLAPYLDALHKAKARVP